MCVPNNKKVSLKQWVGACFVCVKLCFRVKQQIFGSIEKLLFSHECSTNSLNIRSGKCCVAPRIWGSQQIRECSLWTFADKALFEFFDQFFLPLICVLHLVFHQTFHALFVLFLLKVALAIVKVLVSEAFLPPARILVTRWILVILILLSTLFSTHCCNVVFPRSADRHIKQQKTLSSLNPVRSCWCTTIEMCFNGTNTRELPNKQQKSLVLLFFPQSCKIL